jgi:hypothetical protein
MNSVTGKSKIGAIKIDTDEHVSERFFQKEGFYCTRSCLVTIFLKKKYKIVKLLYEIFRFKVGNEFSLFTGNIVALFSKHGPDRCLF